MQKSFKTIINEMADKIKKLEVSASFPAQAAKIISDMKPWKAFSTESFATEFLSTDTFNPQFSFGDGFGQPAITLWANENFRIELYFWNYSNTSIHSHSFAGAFTVVEGLSFQTSYKAENISHNEEEGTCELNKTKKQHKFLYPEIVETIIPGDSFCHEVIHLFHPTVTLIIRTNKPLTKQMQLLKKGTFGFNFLTVGEIGSLNKKLSLLNSQTKLPSCLLKDFLKKLPLNILLNLRINSGMWGFLQTEHFQQALQESLSDRVAQVYQNDINYLLTVSDFEDSEDPIAVLTSCCYLHSLTPAEIQKEIESLPHESFNLMKNSAKTLSGDMIYEQLYKIISKKFF
jgi:hypothetical protein